MVTKFDDLKEAFVDKGLTVFIGEYGATHQDGYEDYQRHYVEYMTKAAVDRRMVVVIWDNGGRGSGGEKSPCSIARAVKQSTLDLLAPIQRAAQKSYALSDIALPRPTP